MAGGSVATFVDANFDEEVLKSPVPVLVDFWAPWCAPCRAMAPVVDELADEYLGRVRFGKVNVDENMRTAARYRITSIPTFLLFKGGQVVDQLVGNVGKAKLKDMVSRHL